MVSAWLDLVEVVGTLAASREWLMAGPNEPEPIPFNIDDLLRRPTWQAEAACRGNGAPTFFPTRGASLEPARALCARCMVRQPCLAMALADPELQGVWAGTSAKERRTMRRGEPKRLLRDVANGHMNTR
jgi:WhiB family redox-sensing transcriptional regulator